MAENDQKKNSGVAAGENTGADAALSPLGLSSGGIGAYAPELTMAAWDAAERPWNASPQGRLAIRVFSRGVMGAAFFTAGGALAGKWLKDYDAEASLLKQTNPLAVISKLIDAGVGKPIEFTVRSTAKIAGHEAPELLGKRAVTFRDTHNFTTAKSTPKGRSLGHEASMVTFDFFCASVGDALGRDLVGWVDPNSKKRWMKDGHIDWPEAIKSMMKTTWRYVSYNGGEDWAVAIPYSYFMKAQRGVINHFSPGFQYDFDRQLNGGSMRMEDGHVAGNYNRAGILDLQNRFVVYNMGTLMYREVYNLIGDKLKGKKNALWGAPDKDPPATVGERMSNGVKWFVRSVIKGGIYMTPSVPFFWMTRTPQSKYRGLNIDPEKGILRGTNAAGQVVDITAEYAELASNYVSRQYVSPEGKTTTVRELVQPTDLHYVNPHTGVRVDAKMSHVPEGMFHPNAGKGVGNLVGRRSDAARGLMQKGASWADNPENTGWFGRKTKEYLGKDFRELTNSYVNAAVSYMPYMYAKAEFGNLWDDGKMDMSIERMIDGAVGLNLGEFKCGLRDIGYSILHKPLPEEEREAEAQRRIMLDTSAAVDFTETKGEMSQRDTVHQNLQDTKQRLRWSERILHGGSRRDPKVSGHKQSASFAEQEEMRKALEELQPPTNSIN